MVSIASDGPLSLVDLRGDGPVCIGPRARWPMTATMRPGAPCRARSTAECRRRTGSCLRPRFTGDSCVAIFERAFGRLRATGIAELVRHAEFLEALDDYDIVLTGPPGRAE